MPDLAGELTAWGEAHGVIVTAVRNQQAARKYEEDELNAPSLDDLTPESVFKSFLEERFETREGADDAYRSSCRFSTKRSRRCASRRAPPSKAPTHPTKRRTPPRRFRHEAPATPVHEHPTHSRAPEIDFHERRTSGAQSRFLPSSARRAAASRRFSTPSRSRFMPRRPA